MTPSRPEPAITAMWVSDNPVPPALDPRGRGYAPATPDRLAAFARAGGLREVFLAAPSGPAGGPAGDPVGDLVDEWLRATVAALHDDGVSVSAVTGVRGATAAWATSTLALAPFDRLQVVVLPWAAPDAGAADVGRGVVDALAALRAGATTAGRPLGVDACVPGWFASTGGDDGRPLLGPVARDADRVVIAAPAAHAHGPGGVLDVAAAAVAALTQAGRPFAVGVETDSPEAAGGADRTFWDEGPVAMVRECGAVAAGLADVPGFGGVVVMSHRAWRRLLGV